VVPVGWFTSQVVTDDIIKDTAARESSYKLHPLYHRPPVQNALVRGIGAH
jgi:hypothetical protein